MVSSIDMFTGLVEETGRIIHFDEGDHSWRLEVQAEQVCCGLSIGDSVAINGCCLTVTTIDKQILGFDLLGETVRLTSFEALQPGSLVNLERSLLPTTRMGGHFVSGHVDTFGTIEIIEPRGKDIYLKIVVPQAFRKYLAYKGSVALDGISLTVAEVLEDGLAVWIIPHTIAVTNLKEKQPGSRINIEFDLLAKYVERLLQCQQEPDANIVGQ
jgi:riboflavin synthase